MRKPVASLLALASVGLLATAAAPVIAPQIIAPQKSGGAVAIGPYEQVEDWPQMAHPYARPGYVLGSQGGIFAESPNRIFIANRGEIKLPSQLPAGFNGFWWGLAKPGEQPTANTQLPELRNCIIIVDANGKLVDSWTQWDHLCADGRGPHAVRLSPYDPERHVWIIDDYHDQIFEFTNDGKTLVRTLGVRDEGGDDATHFRRPTDMDWLPDGTFFVSDGYGNTRVVKFDKNGNYLKAWGTRGTEPGQFNTPHGIAVGPDRHVYVSDRSNKRIQVFDENGKFLAQWPKITAQTLMLSANGHIWLFDSDRWLYVEYDLNGKELSNFQIPDTFTHQISADSQGNVYGAGSRHGQPFKFRPEAGADPSKLLRAPALIGKEVVFSQGKTDFSGTWKLVAKTDPSGRDNAAAFGAAAPTITIAQTGTDLAYTSGPVKLAFKLNGSKTANPNYVDPASGAVAETTVNWDGEKLVLVTKQGLNLDKDTLALSGNTLNIVRDINTAGGSYVVNLTYTK